MSQAFPLIRASVLVPFARWLRQNGRPVETTLRAADLALIPWDEPDRAIALSSALAIVREIARQEGPDIGCRVVSETSIADLGALGQVMLSASTPREALMRAAVAMPRHCTHQQVVVTQGAGRVTISERLNLDMDPMTRHIAQQYVAALVRALCRATGFRDDPFERVELMPHPEAGLDHLRGRLGPMIYPSTARALSLVIPNAVIDRPLQRRDSGALPDVECWDVLRGEKGFASTARVFVEAMLEDGAPSVERLAAAAGISLRTLQRRLAQDETSYSELLDEIRRNRAVKDLATSTAPISHIAAELGYSGQPAFIRAVRRWTDMPPRRVRRLADVGTP